MKLSNFFSGIALVFGLLTSVASASGDETGRYHCSAKGGSKVPNGKEREFNFILENKTKYEMHFLGGSLSSAYHLNVVSSKYFQKIELTLDNIPTAAGRAPHYRRWPRNIRTFTGFLLKGKVNQFRVKFKDKYSKSHATIFCKSKEKFAARGKQPAKCYSGTKTISFSTKDFAPGEEFKKRFLPETGPRIGTVLEIKSEGSLMAISESALLRNSYVWFGGGAYPEWFIFEGYRSRHNRGDGITCEFK